MSNTKKIFIVASILFLALIIILGPGLSRCFIYYQTIASVTSRISNPDTGKLVETPKVKTLGIIPEMIHIPPFDSKTNFSLGYAQCYIDPNLINTIKFVNGIIIIEGIEDGYSYGFLLPVENNDLIDEGFVHESLSKELGEIDIKQEFLPKDFFEAQLTIVKTYPKNYSQIYCMSGDEFTFYIIRCMLKIIFFHNQNGIGIFENDNIKGIIRFGAAHAPNKMFATIYSKNTRINQEIMVCSNSPEKTKTALLSLLSSYSYLIDQPLNETILREMVFDAISLHHRFQPESSD